MTETDALNLVSSGDVVKFRVPVRAAYEPKEDITAYELAQMIPFIHGQHYFDEEWESLPWTRHFRRIDK